jgi:hypothetical protein
MTNSRATLRRSAPRQTLRAIAGVALFCGAVLAPGRVWAQDEDTVYFSRTAQLYGRLLDSLRTEPLYDRAQMESLATREGGNLQDLASDVASRPGLARLRANLGDLGRWMHSGRALDHDVNAVVKDVQSAVGSANILSRRIAERVGVSQAVAQTRLAVQTHSHLALLSIYQEFLAVRQEWELGRIRAFMARTDVHVRHTDSVVVARLDTFIVILRDGDGNGDGGGDAGDPAPRSRTLRASLGPVVYTNGSAGVGVLLRRSRWLGAVETTVVPRGAGALSGAVSGGHDVGPVSLLGGLLVERAGALRGSVMATLVLSPFQGVQPGISLSSRGDVGLKVLFRP